MSNGFNGAFIKICKQLFAGETKNNWGKKKGGGRGKRDKKRERKAH